jgi:photosynthetic reaction center cytochrome c subunit
MPLRLALSLLGIVAGTLLFLAMMSTWERPPMATTQLGFRGTGMVEIENPRRHANILSLNAAPAVADPVENSGIKAKDNPDFQNIQVLGELDTEQFNRLMGSITEWVAPTEGDNAGCAYCHNVENMADDSLYTKQVARKMILMTQAINTAWKPHVAETGVTCYTCHRGHPVPQNVWYQDKGLPHARGLSADRGGNNLASFKVGTTSLPYDPFTTLFAKDAKIRIETKTALPSGNTATIQDTEKTYALMMHMSQGLGVNCTFCHNSRHFSDWAQSTPQRVTAWHGIKMVSDINATHLTPLTDLFPANRKGPQGDVAKVACSTCHNGLNKPLNGVSMVKAYPELSTAFPQ